MKQDIITPEKLHSTAKKIKLLYERKCKKSLELSKSRSTVIKLRKQIKEELKELVKIRQSPNFTLLSGRLFRRANEYVDHIMNEYGSNENWCDPPMISSASYYFKKLYESTMECGVCRSDIVGMQMVFNYSCPHSICYSCNGQITNPRQCPTCRVTITSKFQVIREGNTYRCSLVNRPARSTSNRDRDHDEDAD